MGGDCVRKMGLKEQTVCSEKQVSEWERIKEIWAVAQRVGENLLFCPFDFWGNITLARANLRDAWWVHVAEPTSASGHPGSGHRYDTDTTFRVRVLLFSK